VGAHFDAREVFGTVESVKAVSEIYCPVAGTVAEVNGRLAEDPALLNREPHTGAWLIRVTVDDPKQVGDLLTAEQYEAFIHSSEAES
jgi:glycine cleavage system H protein